MWMHGVSIEWREARFLLERVVFSRRGEEGSSVLTLARTDGPSRSISQSYWAAAGGSVQLINLGSFWGIRLCSLLDRRVKLGSSHCRGATFIFSLWGDAGLDLLLDWEARLGSVTPDATLDLLPGLESGLGSVLRDAMLSLLPGRETGLGSVLRDATLDLLLGWRSTLSLLLRWEAGVTWLVCLGCFSLTSWSWSRYW